MSHDWDDAVVGAGILGLAHAYHLGRRGRRVLVFERNSTAQGASIRNFGMLWPIGQPAGFLRRLALRSRDIWLSVLQASGLWHDPVGSLHLAYHEDEAQVLREFVDAGSADVFNCDFLGPEEILRRAPAVNPKELLGGMWSAAETCIDPRQVIEQLPKWLNDNFQVEFRFNHAVTAYDSPVVLAGGKEWTAERLWVCAGDDFQTLYPEAFQASGQVRCKLQMMRSQPRPMRLGPMLAGGLTLRHYKAFQHCPSLPTLQRRVAATMPKFDCYGIHVMLSQNQAGELVIGDSHEYGAQIDPFDKQEIDDLILDYLQTFINVPDLTIAEHWHGTYSKHPEEPFLILHPGPNVTVSTGVGGAGMTLAFGFAEHVIHQEFKEQSHAN